jgi:hypothetical protein
MHHGGRNYGQTHFYLLRRTFDAEENTGREAVEQISHLVD